MSSFETKPRQVIIKKLAFDGFYPLLVVLSTCLEQIHSQDLNVSNSKYAFHNVNKNKDDFITFL